MTTSNLNGPPPDLSVPAIEIKDLSVTLGQYRILTNVTAQVPKAGQTVIIGPNGGGKTTLITALLGHQDHSGAISFTSGPPQIGYVPQRMNFDRHLPLTVGEYLALGLSRKPLWLGVSSNITQQALTALEMVKAAQLIKKPLGGLSGGELQRVLLAGALSREPEILILDEPATGVDVYGEHLLCELLEGFKERFTILMVSHDLATARAHADWVIGLNRTVIAQGPPEEIFRQETLAAIFGLHLLDQPKLAPDSCPKCAEHNQS